MRQRHVAHAERVVHPQHAERIVDGMPALDADQGGDLALLMDAHDIVSGGRHGERIGIGSHHAVDNIDLLQGFAHRRVVLHRAARHKRRPELGADSSLPEPRDIGVQILLRTRDVNVRKREVLLLAELPWEIVMAVDQDSVAMNVQRLIG